MIFAMQLCNISSVVIFPPVCHMAFALCFGMQTLPVSPHSVPSSIPGEEMWLSNLALGRSKAVSSWFLFQNHTGFKLCLSHFRKKLMKNIKHCGPDSQLVHTSHRNMNSNAYFWETPIWKFLNKCLMRFRCTTLGPWEPGHACKFLSAALRDCSGFSTANNGVCSSVWTWCLLWGWNKRAGGTWSWCCKKHTKVRVQPSLWGTLIDFSMPLKAVKCVPPCVHWSLSFVCHSGAQSAAHHAAVCWYSSCLLPPQASFSCLYLYIKWASGKIPDFPLFCALCCVSMQSFPLWRWHGWEMAHCSNRRQQQLHQGKANIKAHPRQRAGGEIQMWYSDVLESSLGGFWQHKNEVQAVTIFQTSFVLVFLWSSLGWGYHGPAAFPRSSACASPLRPLLSQVELDGIV